MFSARSTLLIGFLITKFFFTWRSRMFPDQLWSFFCCFTSWISKMGIFFFFCWFWKLLLPLLREFASVNWTFSSRSNAFVFLFKKSQNNKKKKHRNPFWLKYTAKRFGNCRILSIETENAGAFCVVVFLVDRVVYWYRLLFVVGCWAVGLLGCWMSECVDRLFLWWWWGTMWYNVVSGVEIVDCVWFLWLSLENRRKTNEFDFLFLFFFFSSFFCSFFVFFFFRFRFFWKQFFWMSWCVFFFVFSSFLKAFLKMFWNFLSRFVAFDSQKINKKK